MPGPLTWREIAAPDFRGAIDGWGTASEIINRGLNAAKNGVKDIENRQIDSQSNQALMDLLSYQGDPARLTQDMQTGAFQTKYNPRLLSSAALAAIAARPGELSDRKYTDYQHFAAVQDDQTMRDYAPFQNEAAALRSAGKYAEADALLASPDAQAARRNLNVQQALDLFGGNGRLESTNLLNDRTRQENTQTGVRFNWESTDRADQIKGNALALQIVGNSVDQADVATKFNPEGIKALKEQGYTDTQIALARRFALGDQTIAPYDFAGAANGGGSLSGAGGPPMNVGSLTDDHRAVAATLSDGGLSAPVVAGFLGNFHVEGGWNGAQGDGGSASGIAQWRNERRQNFIDQFGKDPSQASKADQAKFVLWELNNPAKAGMKAEDVARIKAAKTPEEAAQLIDALYERSNGKSTSQRVSAATSISQLLAGKTGASTTLKQNLSGDPNVEVARSFLEKWSDKTPPKQIAIGLTAKGQVFEGENPNYLTTKLTEVMQRYHVNAAVAADMLSRATNGEKSQWNPDTWKINPFGSGIHASFNEDLLAQYGKMVSNPDALRNSVLATEAQSNALANMDATTAELGASVQQARARSIAAARLGRNVDQGFDGARVGAALDRSVGAVGDGTQMAIAGQRPTVDDQEPKPAKGTPLATAGAAAEIARRNIKPASVKAETKKQESPVIKINQALDGVRATSKKVVENRDKPPATQWRLEADRRRAITAAIDAAITSGLPQFKMKPNEGSIVHRERVQKALKLY